MSGPVLTVRRCRVCGEPAAVPVRSYGQSVFFGLVKTGRVMAEDFVCQSCGAGFHVGDSARNWVFVVFFGAPFAAFGTLFALGGVFAGLSEGWGAAVGGLLCGGLTSVVGWSVMGLAYRPIAIVRASPVVPGAEPPVMRFFQREPIRRCSCGYPVRCHEVVANRTNGIPTGTEYHYRCTVCGNAFTIESPWEAVFSTGGSLLLLGIFALVAATGDVSTGGWVCSAGLGLMGAGGLGMTLWRLLARYRFPVIAAND